MTKPRLLDLFCGAGGAAMGYARAGFDIVGVDIKHHPDYPFELIVADAMDVLTDLDFCRGFAVRHASPPCQRYSTQTRHDTREKHPDLIAPVRSALLTIGGPYVIENVEGSRRHLNHPVKLCGSSFGLGVWRHRYFEVSEPIPFQHPCQHTSRPWTVTGDHGDSRDYVRPLTGTLRARKPRSLEHAREVMGIDWMGWEDLSQAIPPVYTEWLGTEILSVLTDTVTT